ncbi:Hypothetical_protein [Hexamita inflata]|uniref:Hypothetical_protein n=1 Tax=Hexamita inflata TaxID=28002 RepID=A0AA86QM53_9EUKA|nr:Hypothetical protein HINF_LOCUS48740 [Hexamita inflata]
MNKNQQIKHYKIATSPIKYQQFSVEQSFGSAIRAYTNEPKPELQAKILLRKSREKYKVSEPPAGVDFEAQTDIVEDKIKVLQQQYQVIDQKVQQLENQSINTTDNYIYQEMYELQQNNKKIVENLPQLLKPSKNLPPPPAEKFLPRKPAVQSPLKFKEQFNRLQKEHNQKYAVTEPRKMSVRQPNKFVDALQVDFKIAKPEIILQNQSEQQIVSNLESAKSQKKQENVLEAQQLDKQNESQSALAQVVKKQQEQSVEKSQVKKKSIKKTKTNENLQDKLEKTVTKEFDTELIHKHEHDPHHKIDEFDAAPVQKKESAHKHEEPKKDEFDEFDAAPVQKKDSAHKHEEPKKDEFDEFDAAPVQKKDSAHKHEEPKKDEFDEFDAAPVQKKDSAHKHEEPKKDEFDE